MRLPALAALTLCIASSQVSPPDTFSSVITADALKGDISFLASDALEGRGTPSRGLDLAAEFIASQFRRAGLDPAGDDRFFENAAFESATVKQAEIAIAFEAGGKTIQPAEGTVSVNVVAAADLKSAPIVVADETTLKTLTPEQVQGKILALIISGGAFRNQTLAKLKPGLILGIPPAGAAGGGSAGPQLRQSGPAPARTPVLLVRDPRVREVLTAKTDTPITASVHIPAPDITPVKLRNVIGILRGSDPQLKDTYLVLTAHYDHLGIRDNGADDHIYNGADDDASGTASLIEIAASLAALPARPKRTVIFIALFGEELGLLGSRYYSQHPLFPLAKTVADVNLEQLGRTDDTQGPHVKMFNLTGYDYTDLPGVFNKAGEQTGIKAIKDEKNSDPYFTRSDNAAFALAGVPSTTLSVAYAFPDYHQQGDEWEKLDYDNMALVDRTIALAIVDLANSNAASKWNESNPRTADFVNARAAQK
jgi:hypothetical protein